MGTITDATISKQFFVLEDDHSRGWHREWYTEYKLKVEYEIKGEKRETYIERTQNPTAQRKLSVHLFHAGKEDRRGSALRPGRRSLHSDGNPCFRSERK